MLELLWKHLKEKKMMVRFDDDDGASLLPACFYQLADVVSYPLENVVDHLLNFASYFFLGVVVVVVAVFPDDASFLAVPFLFSSLVLSSPASSFPFSPFSSSFSTFDHVLVARSSSSTVSRLIWQVHRRLQSTTQQQQQEESSPKPSHSTKLWKLLLDRTPRWREWQAQGTSVT